MREAGYLSQLQQLIYHPEESVQITALVALGNLALNKNNSKEMKVIYLINIFIILFYFVCVHDFDSSDFSYHHNYGRF
jgi:hypothetical protein